MSSYRNSTNLTTDLNGPVSLIKTDHPFREQSLRDNQIRPLYLERRIICCLYIISQIHIPCLMISLPMVRRFIRVEVCLRCTGTMAVPGSFINSFRHVSVSDHFVDTPIAATETPVNEVVFSGRY